MSVRAALDLLARADCGGKKVAFLGDMLGKNLSVTTHACFLTQSVSLLLLERSSHRNHADSVRKKAS